jgi:hypothetical protein
LRHGGQRREVDFVSLPAVRKPSAVHETVP